MLKVKRDILNPETARKVKGMSLSALSDYLWKLYAAGYTAGFLEGGRLPGENQCPKRTQNSKS